MRKIAAALAVAVVLALVASAWAVFGVRARAHDLSFLIDREVATLSALHELAMQAEAGARNARTLLLSGDDVFRQRLIAVRVTIARQMDGLQRQLSRPEQRRLLARAVALRDRIYAEMDQAVTVMNRGDSHAAALHVLRRVEPLREQLSDALVALTSAKRSEIARLSSEQDRTSERALLLTGLFAATALLSGVVFAALLKLALKRESQSEARLRAVFDQCPVGITMSDTEGKLMYVNPAAQSIMAPTGGGVGASTLDLLTDQDRERVARWREEFLNGRTEVSELKLGLQTPSGEVHTVRVQANLLREGDAVRGIVSTLEDITERLRLEEELRQAQKMDAVGKLAGGVAHDFNNLLTVILNGASLLQEGASKEQSALLAQVEAAAERAASLTAQLLAFGRKQVIRPRVVDLNALVANHCRMLQPLVGEKIQLSTTFDPSGSPAEVDPNLIELLLMNLVVNARDAMPFGGRIAIQLESVVAEATRGGALVHLSVRDSGTGIDAKHLPHVFEPFFTTKTVGKGTGLGLSTVYGIVEQHHGRIEVDTVLGKGTTFHVYLPRACADMATNSEPLRGVPGGHETLLLVEDEDPVRQMVGTALRRCGYRVIEAANGDIALALWGDHAREIDLVLTDMVMPGSLSGRDLAIRLRSQRPDLKIVYMSGYGAHELAAEPWSILVQKPFQMSSLAQVLRARLDQNEPAMPAWLMHAGLTVQQRVFQA